MNAIELLKADHKVVADLFKKVEATEESEHPTIFVKIKSELDVHTHVEETIFYPKLKAEGNKELVDIVLEGNRGAPASKSVFEGTRRSVERERRVRAET